METQEAEALAEHDAELAREAEIDAPIAVLLGRVSRAIGAIAKARTANAGGSYQFRGFDDVLDAIHAPLADHGIITVPVVLDYRQEIERWQESTNQGTRMRSQANVRLEYGLDFIGPRGDCIRASIAAEAQDFGDKATAKANSVAYRTIMIHTFSIPVSDEAVSRDLEDDNDQRVTVDPKMAHANAYNAAKSALREMTDATNDDRMRLCSMGSGGEVSDSKRLMTMEVAQLDRIRNLAELWNTGVRFGLPSAPPPAEPVAPPVEPAVVDVALTDDLVALAGDRVDRADHRPAGVRHAIAVLRQISAPSSEQTQLVETPDPEAEARRAALAEKARADVEAAKAARPVEAGAARAEEYRSTLAGWSKQQLVEELTAFGLPTAGTQQALRQRVQEAWIARANEAASAEA